MRRLKPPEDNVIEFRPRDPDDAFIKSKPYGERADRCRHRRAIVDPHNRTVECEACKAVLDPFDYLMGIVHEGDRLTRLYAAIKRMNTELEALSNEERKLKQRVHAWRKKQGAEFPPHS